ncbi:MAG TPA: C45 family autoproteolytic acyltransferase/hydrolase [Polyangiaceae bacterium]|nr:C45 family autoproteolytic acyltransferase/hydrolase [Polyangiaceae bacterium]
MRTAFVIPALDAAASLGTVLDELAHHFEQAHAGDRPTILVVDDGSSDATSAVAEAAGAEVTRHPVNRGKGAALMTGFRWALERGFDCVVTLDADGQHPPRAAVHLYDLDLPADTLVIGTRDLLAAGAPRPNRLSNRFSNLVLSLLSGEELRDTQSGLRRYPLRSTLALASPDTGFAFESDLVLRAARRGLPIHHEPFVVYYPPEQERVTHFDSVRDPARIVRRVLATTWQVRHHRRTRRWARYGLLAALLLGTTLCVAHLSVRSAGRLQAPELTLTREPRVERDGTKWVGRGYATRRDEIWEVGLTGSPEEMGWAHGRLLYEQMIENEGVLFGAFEKAVPSWPLRQLVLDLAVLGYRRVDAGMSSERLRELGAQAEAFSPDPYRRFFPTFQRFVYLSALYDISLSFEHSPLIGCTTFTADAAHSSDGGPLLARAFDFEVDEIFDRQKAVFLVREPGRIPFASVAWPGLVGVVSGMNAEGLAVVVHGARAGETTADGEPVVQTLRRVLSQARNTAEALTILGDARPMVSHLLILNDASGDARAIERVPGRAPHDRKLVGLSAVTNHLEGPDKDDPKNLRVRQSTSTLERRARGDALVASAHSPIGPRELVTWLRDRQRDDGQPWPEGDRRAIDANIATHGVIMNSASRELWVSQGPHLRGRFVRFDLRRSLASEGPLPEPRATIPAER